MPRSVNDAIRRLDGIIADLSQLPPKLELYACQQALKIILHRVFVEGKAADGSDIGVYDDTKKQTFLSNNVKGSLNKKQQKALQKKEFLSTKPNGKVAGLTYKELRELRGLRVDKVDLQFTGALFESIQLVKQNGRETVAITNLERSKIATYLEKKYKKPIFTLGKDEKEELMKKVSTFAKVQIDKIIQKWSK